MNEIIKEYKEFLLGVKNSLFEEKEFSIMTYPDERSLFKILLDKNTQFTAEIKDEKELRSGKITLLFHHLFKRELIKGNISIREIMRDAAPTKGLENFFHPNPKSIYKNPPVGKHGGYLRFENSSPIVIRLRDLSKKYNISGKYLLSTKGEKEKDKKGRNCLKLYLELIER